MKFTCLGLDLADAVLKVVKAISTKGTNPILEGIKICAKEDYVLFTATDLDITIEKKIKADVKKEGEALVLGKLFSEFVKKLKDEDIEISLAENLLRITYMDAEGNIQCMNVSEFPKTEKLNDCDSFVILQKELKELIYKTEFAVSTEDSRPILKGCLLEAEDYEITAVALDGYRLSLVKKALEQKSNKIKIIVPARHLSEICKLLNEDKNLVRVYVKKNFIMADIGHTTVIARLLEGDFINYKQIIPADFSTIATINKQQFENGLERASILCNDDKNNLCKFDIKEKTITLVTNAEKGNIKENISIALHGKDLLIAFNVRYFSEALTRIGEEFIKLYFTSAVAPCLIKPAEGEDFLFLVLPVRIVN
ncbi:MAG: DNA polymerase III subunit beta [Firmicutes bacterium]|nr:DNA polymerase III subunit beta [Bacillota bacterium]